MSSPQLLDELAAAVGPSAVLTDPETTARHRTDWTGRFGGVEAVVVRPADAAAVAAVLAACGRHGVAVVPQGGNTGLVGGSVPGSAGTVVLSTERMTGIGELDRRTGQVTVGAGVTLAQLAHRVAGSGWRHAVDLAARDSATVGGTVATNAGGTHVFRHGSTRRHVAGLEYVTADGAVVTRLGGLLKDNTGYDLAGMLCGSEGTLAVITAVRLRLIPEPSHRTTALVGFDTFSAAIDAAWALRRHCPPLEVIELVDGACVRLVARTFDLTPPFDAPAVLLIEGAGDTDPTADLAAAITQVGVDDARVAVAGSAAQRAELWRFRDDITVAMATLGVVRKYDVSVPAPAVDAVRHDIDGLVDRTAVGATTWWFGHVCDDNLHLNVTGVPDSPAGGAAGGSSESALGEALDAGIYELVASHGGSISAEHGIGRAKAPHLHLSRSAAEIDTMRSIKAALDPSGLLNPGVLLPVE